MAGKKIRNSLRIQKHWRTQALRKIKSEMALNGVSNSILADKLKLYGLNYTTTLVRKMLYYGAFQYAFYLLVLEIIEMEDHEIVELKEKIGPI